MNFTSIFLILLSVLAVSCSDSKHSVLAQNFVEALNYDLGYDIEIIKTTTRQENFIVVRDYDLGTLNAYDLTNYTEGSDVGAFLDNNEDSFYYNVEFAYVDKHYYFNSNSFGNDPIYGFSYGSNGFYEIDYETVYVDPKSGVEFSKVTMTSADLVKGQELVDNLKMKKATQQLRVQFGLGPQRAKEIAGIALQINSADKAQMTTFHYDQYAKAVLGTSFTEIQGAMNSYLEGNLKALDSVYEKAAKVNKISVNKVKRLSNLFIKN